MRDKKIKSGITTARILATTLFVAGTLMSESLSAYPALSIPFEAEPVGAENVYYFAGQSGVPGSENEGFTANSGFVITEKGVVVFDAL